MSGKSSSRGRLAWTVYLLRCRDGSLYTGITNDLAKRLTVHAAGRGSRYTRSRLPVALVYEERRATKSRALVREAAIKRLTKRQKESLVAGLAPAVPKERRRPR
ncbi:MAG: GIY-YIG nuclease family protein [Planctomycetia bacterium]